MKKKLILEGIITGVNYFESIAGPDRFVEGSIAAVRSIQSVDFDIKNSDDRRLMDAMIGKRKVKVTIEILPDA